MDTVSVGTVITLDEAWVSSLEERVDNTKWEDRPGERPTIFKVPDILRGADHKAYEPRIISLGPYHHGKPHLKAMEELKWHYLVQFLRQNPSKSLKDYLMQIKEKEHDACIAYSGEVRMSRNDFVQMMLLDGCFVVEMIRYGGMGRHVESVQNPITSTLWCRSVIAQDMLMLENQLPFFLLQSLFDSAFPDQSVSLTELTVEFINRVIGSKMKIPSRVPSFHHILHLLHFCIIPNQDKSDVRMWACPIIKLMLMVVEALRSKWAEALRSKPFSYLSCAKKRKDKSDEPTDTLPWIPSATHLKEAGVHFKMKKATNFLDITFHNGTMEIPQIQVDDHTNTLFRNLIAFEQCSKQDGTHVTDFAALMDCIIDTAADVALLQQREIIISGLGDSKQIALLFNELCKDVVIDDGCYASIYKNVKNHCGTRCNQWRARLNHDYFSNPWAIFSLFAAIFLFILAITQTIFTVLSYVQPPK